jgi:hypothetical protein
LNKPTVPPVPPTILFRTLLIGLPSSCFVLNSVYVEILSEIFLADVKAREKIHKLNNTLVLSFWL